MNLNEFREAMASDATKENEELKKEIDSMNFDDKLCVK